MTLDEHEAFVSALLGRVLEIAGQQNVPPEILMRRFCTLGVAGLVRHHGVDGAMEWIAHLFAATKELAESVNPGLRGAAN